MASNTLACIIVVSIQTMRRSLFYLHLYHDPDLQGADYRRHRRRYQRLIFQALMIQIGAM
jgi:hypothetical protein